MNAKEVLKIITKQWCDSDDLKSLSQVIKAGSLCGLGQTAANPVLSTLNKFYDVYVRHVVDKKCDAGVCKNLMHYVVVADKCKKCSLCARNCPVNAINGVVGKEPYVIDQSKCVKCGLCASACKFKAIVKA